MCPGGASRRTFVLVVDAPWSVLVAALGASPFHWSDWDCRLPLPVCTHSATGRELA